MAPRFDASRGWVPEFRGDDLRDEMLRLQIRYREKRRGFDASLSHGRKMTRSSADGYPQGHPAQLSRLRSIARVVLSIGPRDARALAGRASMVLRSSSSGVGCEPEHARRWSRVDVPSRARAYQSRSRTTKTQ